MKTIFTAFFLLFSIQMLLASPDSVLTQASLQTLASDQRWAAIQPHLDASEGADRKALLEQIVVWSEQHNWPRVAAKAEKNLGLFHYTLGAYEEVLQHYQKALSHYESLDDRSGQGTIYHLLATFSKKQKDYNKAQDYLDRALAVCTAIKDSACLSTIFDNRGLIFAEQGDFAKAKTFYLITLDIRQRIKDTVGLSYIYSNLAEVASNEGSFELAENYLLQSNVYKALSADVFGQAVNFTNLGELYFKQEKFRRAATYFNQSLELSDRLRVPDLSQWNCRFLSRCYSALADTEQALAFLNKSHQLKDSLLTVEKLRQITEMEARFDTERKEQQIKLQGLEIENQQQRNRNQLMTAAGILLALVMVFSFLFLHYRNRKKHQLQQSQLLFQQELLHATIDTQEQERLRISKDLHDGIGQRLSGLKMAWHQLENNIKTPAQQEQLNNLSKVLGEAAEEVRSISHQMMPKALQAYGLVAACEDLLEQTFRAIPISCSFEQFGLKERLSPKIEVSTYRILQELISNILKHAKATEVGVQLMKSKGYLVMIVEDNGKGFEPATSNSKGHGMMNITSRSQLVQGTIDFENRQPGTVFTLRIPLKSNT